MESEEICELVDAESTTPPPTLPPPTCFEKVCKRINTTTLVKECEPVTYQECDVEIIEQSSETKCESYNTTRIEQQCYNKTEENCRQDFEYICHEYKKPHYGYPAPKKPVYGSTPVPIHHPAKPVYVSTPAPIHIHSTPKPAVSLPVYSTSPAPVYSSSAPPVYSTPAPPVYSTSASAPVLPPVIQPNYGTTPAPPVYSSTTLPPVPELPQPGFRQPKYGSKLFRGKREAEAFHPDPWPEFEKVDPWPKHPGIDPYVKKIPKRPKGYGYVTEAPHIKCSYKPTKNCTKMVEEICEPKEVNTEEEICIDVPTQKANKVCKDKFRMECEVVEKPDREMECDVVPLPPPPTLPPPPPGLNFRF